MFHSFAVRIWSLQVFDTDLFALAWCHAEDLTWSAVVPLQAHEIMGFPWDFSGFLGSSFLGIMLQLKYKLGNHSISWKKSRVKCQHVPTTVGNVRKSHKINRRRQCREFSQNVPRHQILCDFLTFPSVVGTCWHLLALHSGNFSWNWVVSKLVLQLQHAQKGWPEKSHENPMGKSHAFMSQISGTTGSKTMKHRIWGVGFVLIPWEIPCLDIPKLCLGKKYDLEINAMNPIKLPCSIHGGTLTKSSGGTAFNGDLLIFWGRERIIGWSDWIRFDQIGWCPQNGAVIFVFVLQKQRGGGSQDDPYWFWFDWKDWSHKPLVLPTQLIDDKWGT